MKIAKNILGALALYLILLLLYLAIIYNLNREGLGNAIFISLIFTFLLVIAVIYRITVRKKKFLIFQDKIGLVALVTSILLAFATQSIATMGIELLLNKYVSTYSIKEDITVKDLYEYFKNEVTYSDNFLEKRYDNISILYTEEGKMILPYVKEIIDFTEEDLRNILGDVRLNELVLQFDYSYDIFSQKFQGESYPSAVYSSYKSNSLESTINYPVSDYFYDILNSSYFVNNLRHEYAHYYTDTLLKNNGGDITLLPYWFSEGIATYIASRENAFTSYGDEIIPFENMESFEEWDNTSSRQPAYYQVLNTIQYLVYLKGEEVLKEIISEVPRLGFNEAFKLSVGISVKDFEKEFTSFMIDSSVGNEEYISYDTSMTQGFIALDTRLKALVAYIKENPEGYEPYRSALKFSRLLKDWDTYKALYEMLIEVEPTRASNYDILSRLVAAEDIDKALELSEKAVELDSSYEDSYIELLELKIIKNTSNGHRRLYEFLIESEFFSDAEKLMVIEGVLEEENEDLEGRELLLELQEKLQIE
ncbi:tetratricopeptide repeat protein [Alloiococcus sp. CFN-8]|uniref:tetratricopeptide repeat protein n=1 Tax=Alloiococcus sp. CFN-8 TaxID=3416081 RepID=UPI003CEA1808